MPGDFFERVQELRDNVGYGHLTGTVEMDQVYAFNQHEEGWVNFMGRYGPKAITEYHRGGGPKFLGGPLLAEAEHFMGHIADDLFGPNGPVNAMVDDVEELSDDASAQAPLEFGDLKESTHPKVTDDGTVVYDRPPLVPRLSESELDAKAKLRSTAERARTYLPEDHPLHGTRHEENGGDAYAKPTPSIDRR